METSQLSERKPTAAPENGENNHLAPTPCWDSKTRTLWFNDVLVKNFPTHPSPDQIALLAAFQEAGWARWIECPLKRRRGTNRKNHLAMTIKNFNRSQRNKRIRLRGDGTGLGVSWEPIEE